MFSGIKPVVRVTELTVVKGETARSKGKNMTDKELNDFIKFGEENIVQNGYMVGGGWAKHAITIAKELRDRPIQSESKWIGLDDEEVISLAKSAGVYGTDYLEELMEFSASIESKLRSKNDNSR